MKRIRTPILTLGALLMAAGGVQPAFAAEPTCQGVEMIPHLGVKDGQPATTYEYKDEEGCPWKSCEIALAVNAYLHSSQEERAKTLQDNLRDRTRFLEPLISCLCWRHEEVRSFVKENRLWVIEALARNYSAYDDPRSRAFVATWNLGAWECNQEERR